ncbi:hypothetical protein SCUP234_12708 [Seiridium cupressi]
MSAPQPDDVSDTPSVRYDGGAVTDWAAQYLTPEEKDSLETLVADLWDCIYYIKEDTRKESRESLLDGIKSWRWKGLIKKDPVFAPHYVVYGEPPQYRNFQMFCLFLHKQHILQHLAPAEFALKTFFNSGKKDDETLYWVCQWLINAAGDIYDAVSNARESWALWHLTILAQVMVYERQVQAEPDSFRRKELLTCSKAAEYAMRRIPGTTRFNDPEMQVAMDLYFKASNEVKATLEAEKKQIMERIAELEKEMDLVPMPEKQK